MEKLKSFWKEWGMTKREFIDLLSAILLVFSLVAFCGILTIIT